MATTKKPASVAVATDVKTVKAAPAKPVLVSVPDVAPKALEKKAVAAKTAAFKAPAKKPAPAKKAAPVKKPAAKAQSAVGTVRHEVDPEKRSNYIEVAAFYISERRGFSPGNPEQDYLDAAAEIDRLIAAGHFSK
jgi:hypothetical protein